MSGPAPDEGVVYYCARKTDPDAVESPAGKTTTGICDECGAVVWIDPGTETLARLMGGGRVHHVCSVCYGLPE